MKKKKNKGFALRIVQAVIICIYATIVVVELISMLQYNYEHSQLALMIGIVLISVAWAVAYTILAVKGKKSKGANIATLVLGAPFLLGLIVLGICGLLGSIFGYKSLKAKERGDLPEKETEDTGISAGLAEGEENTESIAVSGVAADAVITEAKEAAIVSRNEIKPKKFRYAVFGIITAYYLAILVMGIVGMCSDAMNGVWWSGGNVEGSVTAMNKVTSMLLISLVPTWGFYLMRVAPFRMPNVAKIIIAAVSAVLLAALIIVYFVIFAQYRAVLSLTMEASIFGLLSDATIFIVAPILGVLGFAVCYGMTFLRISPETLEKKKVRKSDYGDGFGQVLKWIFAEIVCLAYNIAISLMRLRMRSVDIFTLLITALFTLCLFVMTEIMCILFVILLFGLFFSVVGSLYMKQPQPDYYVSDNGNSLQLKYDSYDSFGSRERYKDENGNYWFTENGGTSFYPDDSYGTHSRSEVKEADRKD